MALELFIHDSLHTYEHMGFEFRAAYDHLRRGAYRWPMTRCGIRPSRSLRGKWNRERRG
ncbi:MAG TPA: hypothetical protein VI699_12305 [Candidatus Acidoferrales bacterium]|nr:hypothetical protein [Candidatus Acidoferrales bacterium]